MVEQWAVYDTFISQNQIKRAATLCALRDILTARRHELNAEHDIDRKQRLQMIIRNIEHTLGKAR